MTDSGYWQTDTEHDAIHAIAAASEFLAEVQSRRYYWRWFVLAMHAAVQGSLTLALTNGDTVHVQTPGVSSRMLSAFDGKNDFPNPHMDNFLRLYHKAKHGEFLRPHATPLPANDIHERALKSLDEMRDELVHFNSKSWSLEVELILDTARTSCEVLDHLFSNGAIFWRQHDSPSTASRALDSLRTALA